MTISNSMHAIRHGVAFSRMEHVRHFLLSGLDCFDVLDWICPRELFLYDGQVFQTLLLDESGAPLADALIGSVGDDFVILAELRDEGFDLVAWVEDQAPAGLDFSIEETTGRLTHLGLNGPYAWELLASLLGPEVIGLPYLSFFRPAFGMCIRAGKTGEYGYDLLVEPGAVEEFEERLLDRGAEFDLQEASLDDLDVCALENWFFNVRREGRAPDVTPIELQLQWRISRRKEYCGSDAIERRAEAGLDRRVTSIYSDEPLEAGQAVSVEGEEVGRVVSAARSEIRNDFIGLALLDIDWAHPGLSHLKAGDGHRVHTTSPPFLANRSLFVKPQKHNFAGRDEYDFPPIFTRND